MAFLRAQGFGPPRGGLSYRFRLALWGGWILHLGLLSLLVGVFVQQGFHDGGAFQLAEGESLRLDSPRVVFSRERGPLAPESPPPLTVALDFFDPFLHQRGYAPDRASRLRVERAGAAPLSAAVDRAAGLEAGGVTLFQAIPTGLALVVELAGQGQRALHLAEVSHTRLTGSFPAPSGLAVVFGLEAERHFDDPAGTGRLTIWYESPRGRVALAPGTPFDFGGTPARLVTVVRWGGFTYAVDPGIPAVFVGFALILFGAALLTWPAGVAEIAAPGGNPAAWVYLTRGREALLAEWRQIGSEPESSPKELA